MYKICGITDKGLVYKHNEDCYMINDSVYFDKVSMETQSPDIFVAVADGVGGENAGELASRTCLEKLSKMDRQLGEDEIKQYIQNISQEIAYESSKEPELAGMSTTLAGVICSSDKLIIFNVGNSRVYRLRNGNLRQFTTDDTLVQAMYNSGQITKGEMVNHPNKHMILQAIGHEDKNTSLDIHLNEAKNPMAVGDILLLCTDGLSDLVDNNEIQNIMESEMELETICEMLINKAMDAREQDNITVVLIERY